MIKALSALALLTVKSAASQGIITTCTRGDVVITCFPLLYFA